MNDPVKWDNNTGVSLKDRLSTTNPVIGTKY